MPYSKESITHPKKSFPPFVQRYNLRGKGLKLTGMLERVGNEGRSREDKKPPLNIVAQESGQLS